MVIMNKEILRQIGFLDAEIEVYLALLRVGPCLVSRLNRETGLHRTHIYDLLEKLREKGLASTFIESGKKHFQASPPENILYYLEEKKIAVTELVPEIEKLATFPKEETSIELFKGKNGLKTVLEDQLSSKEIKIIGASQIAYETLQFYFKWFDKKRVEKRIKARIIFSKSDKKQKIPFSEIKYLPEKYSSPLAINIYGDRVAIILWSKENPLAIVIKNKEISQGYEKYFELMWRVAKDE